MSIVKILSVAVITLLALPMAALAEEKAEYTITFKDNLASPAELRVPAGAAFTLLVKNEDASAEEFESEELDLEKIIPGNTEAKLNVPALEKGEYSFMGEFHADTAHGVIIAE